MLRKSYAFLIIIILVAGSAVCWSADFDLRKTRWGMTQEEVMASENLEPAEKSPQTLKYNITIMGRNIDLYFTFVEDKLISAHYRLKDNYLNSYHFINAFNDFKAALEKKYGTPMDERTLWKNSFYRDDLAKWGLAVSLGHLEYDSSWETEKTAIKCSLREENYDVLCVVDYVSKEYGHLRKFLAVQKDFDPF